MPVCGLIAQYSATELPAGPNRVPQVFRDVLTKRLTIRGFIVRDFWDRFDDFMRDMPQWIREGRVKYREDIADGLDQAPRAFIGLLRGENLGKMLVSVGADPTR
jgi:NADPH-dependent curcumin reductase